MARLQAIHVEREHRRGLALLDPTHHPAQRRLADFGTEQAQFVRWSRTQVVGNHPVTSGSNDCIIEFAIGLTDLVKRNVMIVGSDNWAVEVRPYPDKGLFLPVHGFLLNVNGVYLIENLDLEALARDKAHEFAFIVEPLKLRGATGSSVAPIAVR